MYIIAAIIIVALIALFIYNSLIAKKNQVSNTFSAIDVMLKKRFDLIPNLVEVVKQYTQHESETLQKITELRNQAVSNNTKDADKFELDQKLSGSIRSLMLNVENYPDLKANSNFIHLQTAWTESEEQIAAARRSYNTSVTSYNNAVMMFPSNLFAGMLGFLPMAVLETTASERENISAKELFNN